MEDIHHEHRDIQRPTDDDKPTSPLEDTGGSRWKTLSGVAKSPALALPCLEALFCCDRLSLASGAPARWWHLVLFSGKLGGWKSLELTN